MINGGIHLHSGTSGTGPVVPRQLLPPPRRFTNRVRELSILTSFLDETVGSTPTVLVLKGQGGVGKTALALRWLSEVVDRFPDGQLQADLALSTGEPVAAEDILGQFLRALGMSSRHIPPGLAERTKLFRSATADRALVVLLDNAVSTAQARVLLPTSVNSVAVITTRRPMLGLMADGAQSLPVGPLDPTGGLELLSRTIGSHRVEAEPDDARYLIELCAGLPVALCVLAARVMTRPRRPLARMVDELRDERARLDALSTEGDLSVRSTFDVAYAGLPDHLQEVYRTLGLHPGTTFSVDAVAAATCQDVHVARQDLDSLVDASLLEEQRDDRYRFHDLIRVHALDQALSRDRDDERAATISRTLEWYLFVAQAANRCLMPARRVLTYEFDGVNMGLAPPAGIEQRATALDWLERNRFNLVAAAKDAAKSNRDELSYHLADAFQPLFILRHHNEQAMEVGEVGLRAAERSENRAAEYSIRKRLARLYGHLGHFNRAHEHAVELLRRAREGEHRRTEASALKSLGLLLVARGDLNQAVLKFEQALEILLALGKHRGEALLRIDLGLTFNLIGNADEAIRHLQVARGIFASASPLDAYNDARAAAALGDAYIRTGDHEPAHELLRYAITVLADQKADHERALAHRTYAELHRKVGAIEAAAQHDRMADALLESTELSPDDHADF